MVDGRAGLFTRSGTTSFDSLRLRTNDPAFAPPSDGLTLNASIPPPSRPVTALTETVLAGLMADAIEAMVAMGFDAERLAQVQYAIVDLAAATLAQTLYTTI